jgi:hypothetical protein
MLPHFSLVDTQSLSDRIASLCDGRAIELDCDYQLAEFFDAIDAEVERETGHSTNLSDG